MNELWAAIHDSAGNTALDVGGSMLVQLVAKPSPDTNKWQSLFRSILLFDHADRQQLAALGDVRTPSIADLFVAVMTNQGVAQ